MSYEKFNPDHSELRSLSIEKNGNISAISRHYNVSRETIYEYFKRDPEGKKIVEISRSINTEDDLDMAEGVFRYNMRNFKDKPALAQRAAEKIIDKKGYLRGWNNDDKSVDAEKSASLLEAFFNLFKKDQSQFSDRTISNNNNDSE